MYVLTYYNCYQHSMHHTLYYRVSKYTYVSTSIPYHFRFFHYQSIAHIDDKLTQLINHIIIVYYRNKLIEKQAKNKYDVLQFFRVSLSLSFFLSFSQVNESFKLVHSNQRQVTEKFMVQFFLHTIVVVHQPSNNISKIGRNRTVSLSSVSLVVLPKTIRLPIILPNFVLKNAIEKKIKAKNVAGQISNKERLLYICFENRLKHFKISLKRTHCALA